MKKLLDLIVKTVFDMANFGILLFLFIYIYALLGMQFFANRLKFDDEDYPIPLLTPEWYAAESPRANFDNLWWAVITIFQVLTGENWNAVMYDGMRGGGQTIGLIYFLSLVIIGTFVRHSLTLRHPNTPLQLRASPLHLVLIPASTPPLRTFQACLL